MNILMPKKIDMGNHSESSMGFLRYSYKEHISLAKKGDFLLTDASDRFACGFPVPDFQRDLCWDQEQEISFIESAWIGIPLGTFTIHRNDWEKNGKPKPFSGYLIDGQQRLTTLQRYWEDKFPVFGLLYSELTKADLRRFDDRGLLKKQIANVNQRSTPALHRE